MSTDTKLRDELDEAIAKVRHRIDVQASSNHYIGSEEINAEAMHELQDELSGLEAARADVNRR